MEHTRILRPDPTGAHSPDRRFFTTDELGRACRFAAKRFANTEVGWTRDQFFADPRPQLPGRERMCLVGGVIHQLVGEDPDRHDTLNFRRVAEALGHHARVANAYPPGYLATHPELLSCDMYAFNDHYARDKRQVIPVLNRLADYLETL